jgi:anti-sigma factor RsiW
MGLFVRHPARWLAPYAEGLLPTAQAGAVAAHVFGCRRCRRALELVRVGQGFAASLAPAEGEGLSWAELAPQLATPAPRALPSLRWLLAAAATLVIAAGVAAHGRTAPAALDAIALDAHRDDRWQLRTSDEGVARRWIEQGDLSFSPPSPGAGRQFTGASRLAGGALALAYRLGEEPVTLVVGPATGGDAHKQIVRRTAGALEVATWTRDDRTYALVANARVNACTLCHDGGLAALL